MWNHIIPKARIMSFFRNTGYPPLKYWRAYVDYADRFKEMFPTLKPPPFFNDLRYILEEALKIKEQAVD